MIPPIDDDMSDKIILVHVTPVTIDTDTSSPEGKAIVQDRIRAELPAFVHLLMEWETPAHLRDTRSGVLAWRDDDLLEAVDSHSPARRLETLLDTAIAQDLSRWGDLPRIMTALEVESRLTEMGSPVRDQSKALFTWHGACGSALTKLSKMKRGLVEPVGIASRDKINRYLINCEKTCQTDPAEPRFL
jgi:hypothetical protein